MMIKRSFILAASLLLAACGGGDKKKEPVYHQISVAKTDGGHLIIGDGKAHDRYWGYRYPIVPDEHYELSSAHGCGGRVDGSYYETGAILLDCVITASFTPIQYVASVKNELGGNVTPASATAQYGGSAKFAVAVEAGFELVDITGCDGVLVGANYWVPFMKENCTITAQVAIASSDSIQLNGTVAEGAALANVPVIAKCSDGSGFLVPVTTNAQGSFSGAVANGVLPCALSADDRYYSLASEEGTANITPLTSLVLALASRQPGADWFANANWATVQPLVGVAESLLGAQLNLSGYEMPAGDFEPFTASFELGDEWDQLLDELMSAIAADGGVDSFQALIQSLVQGKLDQLPAASQ